MKTVPHIPSGFHLEDGQLFAEQVSLPALHRSVGSCYVYSRASILARVAALKTAFARRAWLLAYAVKANPGHALLELLASQGLGAEVVSAVELAQALRAGFPPARIVCNGNGKSLADLDAAVAARVACLNLDGAWEAPRLEAAAARAGRRIDVLLRVNPDLDAATHPYISTGLSTSKFGMDFDEARSIVERAGEFPHLRLAGLHVHLGSQIQEPGPIRDGFARVRAFGLGLEGPEFSFEVLNLGGGFGVDYTGATPGLDLEALAASLDSPDFWEGRRLILEPGRFLVAEAGVLLGEVLGEKRSHGRRFVIVDLGMNDLIRPALYEAYHEILPVRPRAGAASAADVVGPICESADFLAQERLLPRFEPGDLVAVRHAGAYGSSMASNYNGRLRLPEVWVDGSRAWVTRRRETLEDLGRADCREEIRL